MDKQPITLQQMLINKFTDNPTLETTELPEHLILLIEEERKKKNAKFQHNAFTDLNRFLDNCPDHMRRTNINYVRFSYESLNNNDILYLMLRIRDNPKRLINLGYNKYTFELKITKIVGDDDEIYELTITEPASGFKSLYSEVVGRFD